NIIHCPIATALLKAFKRGGGIADTKDLKHNPLRKTCFNLKLGVTLAQLNQKRNYHENKLLLSALQQPFAA
ncbi:MAG: hypothetical protein K8F24_04125, partial [Bacteroidales bacterium]|nr:hypothetical protein [Bacteroidales bacterium]